LAGAFGILIGFSVLKSLAAEKAQTSAIRASALRLASISAEIIPDKPDKASLMVSTEGLQELEEEPFRVHVPPIEAPKLRGIDHLIPPVPTPLEASEPVPVEGVEAGQNGFDVSREFARQRTITDAKTPHGLVGHDTAGRMTGSFAALS
jgi:hypothetical protein